jgi:hypothetical protein
MRNVNIKCQLNVTTAQFYRFSLPFGPRLIVASSRAHEIRFFFQLSSVSSARFKLINYAIIVLDYEVLALVGVISPPFFPFSIFASFSLLNKPETTLRTFSPSPLSPSRSATKKKSQQCRVIECRNIYRLVAPARRSNHNKARESSVQFRFA